MHGATSHTEVGIRELKINLSKYIERVRAGEEVVVIVVRQSHGSRPSMPRGIGWLSSSRPESSARRLERLASAHHLAAALYLDASILTAAGPCTE